MNRSERRKPSRLAAFSEGIVEGTMAEPDGLQRIFPYRGFSNETESDLRDLLGDNLPKAMPSLLTGAGVYVSTRNHRKAHPRIRRQLEPLSKSLRHLEVVAAKVSVEARRELWVTYDRDAIVRETPALSALESLSAFDAILELLLICKQARKLVEKAMKPMPRANTRQRLLALMVAGALEDIGAPISKGQSGIFARVLRIVWHDVEPDGAPEEVFRHLKEAADRVLAHSPHLRPRKGRPSRLVKRVRSATS
jgi:hypothetical protein